MSEKKNQKNTNSLTSEQLFKFKNRNVKRVSSFFRKLEEIQYNNDDLTSDYQTDELCSAYLLSFLEGTTDANDNCEGIQNAYIGAYCGYSNSGNGLTMTVNDDYDDYFGQFHHFSCCQSLKNHYDEYCERKKVITNIHLLLIASVLLLCEMAKSLIKKHDIHFLPEAGGCILVGTFVGLCAHLLPNFSIDDLSFDEDLFLCVLLPPIIFDAALSVNKREFRRRRLAILMFAVVGTVLSTIITGYIVTYTSTWFSNNMCIHLPMLDSFVFGALISSIDPVAILSVLTSLKLSESDTIFIMVFGESLLNDGIAITMFKALVVSYGSENEGVNIDDILGFIADFLIVGFGSISVGVICGFACLLYFWFFRKKLNAAMEVASFFLWAGIPYYVCDGLGWSGIVSIVTMGFFMDVYIAAPKRDDDALHQISMIRFDPKRSEVIYSRNSDFHSNYIDLGDSTPCNPDVLYGKSSTYVKSSGRSIYSLRTLNIRELLFREERFRLSTEADRHVRFVAHLLAQFAENCIFVYLGLFLFSKNYKWNLPLVIISILSCILSRALMVWTVCLFVWYINLCRNCRHNRAHTDNFQPPICSTPYVFKSRVSRTAVALQDPKVQLVLVLSGLRGAVSLALVENVPIFNGVTGEGSRYKPEMKAMTSGAIIFTVFVFGGGAYFILRRLKISPDCTHTGRDSKESLRIPRKDIGITNTHL